MAEKIVAVHDERTLLAEQALMLIRSTFEPNERQPTAQIAMEIAEKRLGLLTTTDFHLFAAVDEDFDEAGTVTRSAGEIGVNVVGVAAGVYLGGVNSGFVTYLAVREGYRERHLGRRMRTALVEAFQADAMQVEWAELAAVVGEVRLSSPWLARLYRDRGVLPLDLTYYHPGEEPGTEAERWVLYRQPFGDPRADLPANEVRQLLYAIWRRAYRVRWPLDRSGFQMMLRDLEGREIVGAHPEVGV